MVRRILVLSPCDVFPPVHGSSTAIYHTLQYLSENNRVHAVLCALYSQRGEVDLVHPNLSLGYSRESPLDRLGYKGLIGNPLYYRAAWRAARAFRPDVIQAELLWTAPVAMWLRRRIGHPQGVPLQDDGHRQAATERGDDGHPQGVPLQDGGPAKREGGRGGVPVVLMQENVEYEKFRRFGMTSPLLKTVHRLEGWACRAADRVVALSEVDRDFMVELYGVPPERFALIPHGVDPELFDYRPEGAAAARQKLGLPALGSPGAPDVPILTFVGKLDYLPNVRAVGYIAEQIAPAVWEQHPQAKFVIIGQGTEAVEQYRRDGLIFTGFVDARAGSHRGSRPNLSDYLSASDVVLVPLDSGSGTRLKIVEAAANARAVVSTRLGAEGQDFDGEEIVLTDAVDRSFVEATLRLLSDAGLRERMGRAARAKVLARYSWRAQVRKMEQVYEGLGI